MDGTNTTDSLCGRFDIEAIEEAFFNHDQPKGEIIDAAWNQRRLEWASFKWYLANHRRATIPESDPARRPLAWWKRDRLGWPIETIRGRPIRNAIRLIVQNVRKVIG